METLSRDVLPAGIRRRLSARDGRLPAILLGELMAGMALGMVWPALTAPPPPVPQTAMTAVRAPVPVVPAMPQVQVPVPVPLRSAPRNPFGVPQGVDPAQVPAASSAQTPAAVPTQLPPLSPGQQPVAGVVPVPPAPLPRPAGGAVSPPLAPAGPAGGPQLGGSGRPADLN